MPENYVAAGVLPILGPGKYLQSQALVGQILAGKSSIAPRDAAWSKLKRVAQDKHTAGGALLDLRDP